MPARRLLARAQFPALIPWIPGAGTSALLEGRRKMGVISAEAVALPEAWLLPVSSGGLSHYDSKSWVGRNKMQM